MAGVVLRALSLRPMFILGLERLHFVLLHGDLKLLLTFDDFVLLMMFVTMPSTCLRCIFQCNGLRIRIKTDIVS